MNEITQKEVEILNFIVEDNKVSQRKISNNLGISLGIVNLFLKKLLEKGLIKIKKTSNRKSLQYILTPKGFNERLSFNFYFLKKNFKYYSEAKNIIINKLSELYDSGARNIYIYGIDDWSEIIFLAAQNFQFTMRGFTVDTPIEIKTKINHPVISITEVVTDNNFDFILLANLESKNNFEKNNSNIVKNIKIVYF